MYQNISEDQMRKSFFKTKSHILSLALRVSYTPNFHDSQVS